MAGLPDKIVGQVAFKAGGDIFHHLIAKNPKHLANVIPGKVQDCELHQGDYGTNGSVIQWKYTLGKRYRLYCMILRLMKLSCRLCIRRRERADWKTSTSRHRRGEEADLLQNAGRRSAGVVQEHDHQHPCRDQRWGRLHHMDHRV